MSKTPYQTFCESVKEAEPTPSTMEISTQLNDLISNVKSFISACNNDKAKQWLNSAVPKLMDAKNQIDKADHVMAGDEQTLIGRDHDDGVI